MGPVDCLVGPVGSGGSTGGLAAALRTARRPMRMIGVDTHGSTIFGHRPAPRLLRGLGSSIHPGNVSYPAYDDVHWVTAAEAFRATHALYRDHALFMGPTSGASYLAGAWWARHHPDDKVLMILPDEGHRYQQTVYSGVWLSAQGIDMTRRPAAGEPALVTHPLDAPPRWARLAWGRRGYQEVTGREKPC
jgi:S-sulfo-L-cysteine synthase (3-phospho-L-serine-dependent)